MAEALLKTSLAGLPVYRGKVRDVYDLGGDRLLFVATDRISAFDWVMPNGIPDKGRVLTGISDWWFDEISMPHHRISTDLRDAGLDAPDDVLEQLAGRSMVVRKTEVVPFECVVRGYLSGSAWKEYRAHGTVCGQPLPPGLVESDRIDPLFTPATKATSGHDENVPFSRMVEALGPLLAGQIKGVSEAIYLDAARYCLHGRTPAHVPGLILADTKFEFGIDRETGELLLIDEVLTPDSSRYWPADQYKPGGPQSSFDKQFVRDWLEAAGWDKSSPPPRLPDDVVARTREKYVGAYETLTGRPFAWK
ncbi:MAG: phosphoribosylaminoimidazolesuccinocarboxamide synthase [Planctomycetia bacterium]|nr:phosphoribosylaminoimidazolesuccinocarboxamide synthase [Planctomycetia bacterium]